MKCFECGSKMVSKRENYNYGASGLPVTLVGVEVRRCTKCKEHEVVIPRIEALHRMLAECVVVKKQRLAPGEIRYLRKWLGWSGQDFAERIGVSPETVSRWETGKEKMSGPADRALRLMVCMATPVSEYPTPPLEAMAAIGQKVVPVALKAKASKDSWSVC